MRLADYLDKGASLGPGAPCLTMAGRTRSYGDVQRLSWLIGRALARSGIRPGDKVAVLSGNDPVAFSCVFGISRAGAIWCPVNPRNEAAENRELLDLFECSCLIFQEAFAPLVQRDRRRTCRGSPPSCAWMGTPRPGSGGGWPSATARGSSRTTLARRPARRVSQRPTW